MIIKNKQVHLGATAAILFENNYYFTNSSLSTHLPPSSVPEKKKRNKATTFENISKEKKIDAHMSE